MFDNKWFLKYQKTLLWFANTWIGRRVFCLKTSSVGKKKIVGILPNAIFWKGKKKNEYVAEFRTHSKFGKRIYHAFKPIWYLIHVWDIVIANNFQPAWNLGFDTLTAYPDTGVGSTTCDANLQVRSLDDVWATVRAAAGTNVNTTIDGTDVVNITCTATNNQYSLLGRSGYTFDTSSIADDATISSAVCSIYSYTSYDNMSITPDFGVVSFAPNDDATIVAADFTTLGTTRYCDTDIAWAAWTAGGYQAFTFNATGKAAVDVTGITGVGLRFDFDIDNSAPTWSSTDDTYGNAYFADKTGTANDPKLVVTYTLPSSAFLAIL